MDELVKKQASILRFTYAEMGLSGIICSAWTRGIFAGIIGRVAIITYIILITRYICIRKNYENGNLFSKVLFLSLGARVIYGFIFTK